MCDWKNFPLNWASFPKLAHHGNVRGAPYYTSACPIEGGTDRISIYPQGNPVSRLEQFRTLPYMICRSCNMWKRLDETGPRPAIAVKYEPPRPLDPEIALSAHRALTPQQRAYYHQRGISDAMVDRSKLGFAETGWKRDDGTVFRLNRFSIPCWVKGKLMAVQYRLRPEVEKWLKLNRPGEKIRRYVSWPGGSNRQLFNADLIAELGDVPVVFIVEGPLDALAMSSIVDANGHTIFPTVAPFQGNNTSHSWQSEWTPYISRCYTRVIIPDNKGKDVDELIALNRQSLIPGSFIHPLPDGYGDVGELIQKDLATAPQRVAQWLKPILQVSV